MSNPNEKPARKTRPLPIGLAFSRLATKKEVRAMVAALKAANRFEIHEEADLIDALHVPEFEEKDRLQVFFAIEKGGAWLVRYHKELFS